MPVEPAGAVLEHHAVALRDGAIEKILPAADAARQFPGHERLELPEHVLIPGLVNAYTQAATSLMRGFSEQRKTAAEKRFLSDGFVRDGTALACAQMLRGGITCFNDAYFFPAAALEAAREAGMRVSLGLVAAELATAYASDPADYLRKGLELRDRCGGEPLVSFCFAPQALPDAPLRQIATLAAELDLPVQLVLRESGARPLERLRALGLLGPGLTAARAVGLEESEIRLLARHGCSVAHCPSSELRRARGFAAVALMLKSGVNVALGTDGAASNERLDLFTEMRSAALLAKAVARDAQALSAHEALRAATLGGARALGLGTLVGSIEPGKRADLTALALRGPELAPCYDPVSQLVYAAGREHVTHVWVDGDLRVRDSRLENAAASLDTRWRIWQNALESRADS